MSYVDQRSRRNPASIVAVVAVHAAIGYAFITGMAMRVIPSVTQVLTGYDVPDAPPPPPETLPPPPPKSASPTSTPRTADPFVEKPFVEVSVDPGPPVSTSTLPSLDPAPPLPPQAQPQPTADLSRAAAVSGDRAAWVTTDDYPSAALREGVEGTTTISVTIGADGRVSRCDVAQSSGDRRLDEATCRFYQRRAHFRPALDAEGRPTVATRTDRIRWQIPAN